MAIKSSSRQVLQRMNSKETMRMLNNSRGFCGVCRIIERSWSGNLGPPTCNKVRSTYQREDKNSKNQHRRIMSTGEVNYEEAGIEPKLARSGGLRREWSFENLLQISVNGKKKKQTR